jgi:molecular chaperone GrpE
MEGLKQVQETTLADQGVYDLIEGASSELEVEVMRLNEELANERDRNVRMLAEFDNYRRRTREERARVDQISKREVFLALLDVMDDFDRAVLHVSEKPDPIAQGLRVIHQRFKDILRANGITSFDSEGEQFDPTVHEAIAVIEGDGQESGIVFAEERRGYTIAGELLRPARVVVLK